MPRLDKEDAALERAKAVIDAAFPDLRCLRCGQEVFQLRLVNFSDILHPERRVELTCTNCGKVEVFDTRYLQRLSGGGKSGGSDG